MTSTPDASEPGTAITTDVATNMRVLATVPLLAGCADEELEALACVTRLIEAPRDTVLWRQGDEADGLHVVVEGTIRIGSRLPGGREAELATLGPGDVLGEVPLLGGGLRTATARATEDSALLFLGRVEFAGLVAGATPAALTVRRRILALVCERLRRRHAALAAWLGGEPPVPVAPAVPEQEGARATPPPEDYLLRLPFFGSLDRPAAAEVIRRAAFVRVPASQAVVAEGAPATACWITINGAVEELIRRGDEVVRVGLAGPGHAFGYPGLIDGGPSSVAAATRERSLLLVLSPEDFEALFDPAAVGATAFWEAIQRDLVRALRASERPQARLAADGR